MTKVKGLNFAYWLISAMFLSYVVIRVFSVGAVYDEIMTLCGPVNLSFWDAYWNANPIPNNQFLNTLLVKVVFLLAGEGLPLARIPSVLSALLYLYFGYKIALGWLSRYAGILCFGLLIANPFLLDFFSLARGYGLSLAFMMGALYFGLESARGTKSAVQLVVSLSLASLSVVSIYSMIYFWVAIAIFLNAIPFHQKDYALAKIVAACTFVIGLGLAAIIVHPVLGFIKAGTLDYGGDVGFYADTILSLVRFGIYSDDITPLVRFVANSALALILLVALLSYIRSRSLGALGMQLLIIVTLTWAMIVLAHYLAGVRYPLSRVALFLYPLYVLLICGLADSLWRSARGLLLVILVIGASVNCAINMNFYRTSTWGFESHTNEVLGLINTEGAQAGRVIPVACSGPLYESVNYYKDRYPYLSVIEPSPGGAVPLGSEYYIFISRDPASINEARFVEQWVTPLNAYRKEIVWAFPREHLYVFRDLVEDPTP